MIPPIEYLSGERLDQHRARKRELSALTDGRRPGRPRSGGQNPVENQKGDGTA